MIPYAGIHFADDDRFLFSDVGTRDSEKDDGPVVGIRLDVPIRGPWSAELSYGWTSFAFDHLLSTIEEPLGAPARETYDMHSVEAALVWTGLPGSPARPFATLGAGIAHVDFDIETAGASLGTVESDTETAIVGGGGLLFRPAKRIGVRLDLRDHIRFCSEICAAEETLHELELSVGAAIGL